MNRLTYPLLISLFASIAGCGAKAAAEPPPAAPPGQAWLTAEQVKRLTIEPLAEHEVGGTITTAGRVAFHDQHVSHVFSPVSGRVVKVAAQLGQRMKKGEPLAWIESPDIGSASSDRTKAEADLIAAAHDNRRKRELYEAHAGSESDAEQSEDNYRKAKAELERAKQKARLLSAGSVDTVTGTYMLRASIDGEVVARNVSPGIEIQGQYGGGTAVELFTIGELDPIWVFADVYEMDLPRVKPSADVVVKVVAYPDKSFAGKVDWVAGTLDPSTRTARVRCTFPNIEKQLLPEMYATVAIGVEGHKALATKRPALYHVGEQTFVFVERGAAPNDQVRFERVLVTADEDQDGEYVPLTKGVLKAGDRIVTENAILVSSLT